MSQADELQRLAELRDRGVLTHAEFDKRKKQLLKGKRPWWLSGILGTIGAFCLLCILAVLAAILVPVIKDWAAANDLACDTPEVKEKALVLANQYVAQLTSQLGIFAAAMPPGQQIHSLGATTQLYRDPDSGFLACIAKTRNDQKGEGEIGYTVSWRNRNAGEFWVEVVNPAALKARYRATSSTKAADDTAMISSDHEDKSDERPSVREQSPSPTVRPDAGILVATRENDVGVMELHNGIGDCSQERMVAIAKVANGPEMWGCWIEEGGAINIQWEMTDHITKLDAAEFLPDPDYYIAMVDSAPTPEISDAPEVMDEAPPTSQQEREGSRH